MLFTRAQHTGRNQWIRRNGILSPSDEYFYGLGVLPGLGPARARTTTESIPEPPYEEEVDGHAPCLTEVVYPFPFDVDDAGVAFPAGTCGVRSRVWRRPEVDGGDDKEWWTAVPMNLPEGYTAVGRCRIGYAAPADYLGDNPMAGFQWNHRTPTGFLLDTSTPEGLARSKWSPMNLNQQVLQFDTSDASSGIWIPYVPEDFYTGPPLYWVALIADNHIGFRGGKLTWTLGSGYPAGSASYEIVAVKVTDYWDPINADEDSMVEVLTSGSIGITGSETLPVVIEHDLGALLPNGDGIPFNFFIRYPAGDDEWLPIFGSNHHFDLSPRVDVPLPYWASQKNRIATGGIILPP